MEYILKACAVITIFYVCYKLFLQRDTFFQTNRWFLLIGLITAFVLPFVVIPIYIEYTPAPIQNFVINEASVMPEVISEPISIWEYVFAGYLIGAALFLIRFCVQISSLVLLITKSVKHKKNGYTFVESPSNTAPFSFFRWMVYNPNQFESNELQHIIAHEKVHVKQYHSIDIILSQLASIIFWFNPITWFYKKDLQQNLEFIADYKAQNSTSNKKSYQHLLLKTSVPNQHMALTNNFYNSLIKKRIVMLHKSKSKKKNLFKYALVLPFLALFLMSFNTEEVYVAITENSTSIIKGELVNTYSIKNNTSDIEIEKIKAKLIESGATFSYSHKRNLKGNITDLEFKVVSNGTGNFKSSPPFKEVFFGTFHEGGIFIAQDKGNLQEIIEARKLMIEAKNKKDEEKLKSELKYENNKPFIKKSILKISGTVTNTEGLGLPGVNILIDGKSSGSVTDFDGNYRIEAEKGDVLIFSFKGMKTKKVKATKNKIDVVLAPEEIRVIGYANNNNEKPLFILDGKEISNEDIKNINPDNIYSLNVLKTASETALYGDKGKQGVVLITSKNSVKHSVEHQKDSISKSPWKVTIGRNTADLNDSTFLSNTNIFKGTGLKNNNNLMAYSNSLKTKNISSSETLLSGFKGDVIYYLDGNEILQQELKELNPNNIESITVLKGKNTTMLHGVKAKHDVVHIKSKKNSFINLKTKDKNNSKILISTDSGKEPLYIIDGKEIKKNEFKNLDPNNIESISVFKDDSAIEKYGKKGKDGVVIITSKISKSSKLKIGYPINLANSQDEFVISGTVKNDKNLGLPGTNILIKGKPTGVVTDFDGNFKIKVSKGDVLVFSFIGFTTKEVIVKKSWSLDIVLTESLKVKADSTNSSSKALIIIDGKKVKNKTIKDLDPDKIKSLNIFKGDKAIEKYGKKGKYGVIEVTTKKKN